MLVAELVAELDVDVVVVDVFDVVDVVGEADVVEEVDVVEDFVVVVRVAVPGKH